jgi:hypothetical protein
MLSRIAGKDQPGVAFANHPHQVKHLPSANLLRSGFQQLLQRLVNLVVSFGKAVADFFGHACNFKIPPCAVLNPVTETFQPAASSW